MDYVGQQFGKLVALSRSKHPDKRKSIFLTCLCECGNECIVKLDRLKNGRTKSCGCIPTGLPRENLVGRRFNRLLVLEYVGRDSSYGTKWKCKCDCGGETTVLRYPLISNKVKSCGCYNIEQKKGLVGNKNPNFDPTLSDTDREDRRINVKVKEWSKHIKEKFDFKCDVCGSYKPGQLVSHHLYNWKDYPTMRFETTNGVCLCPICHRGFHHKYGYRHTTEEQYIEYKRLINEQV